MFGTFTVAVRMVPNTSIAVVVLFVLVGVNWSAGEDDARYFPTSPVLFEEVPNVLVYSATVVMNFITPPVPTMQRKTPIKSRLVCKMYPNACESNESLDKKMQRVWDVMHMMEQINAVDGLNFETVGQGSTNAAGNAMETIKYISPEYTIPHRKARHPAATAVLQLLPSLAPTILNALTQQDGEIPKALEVFKATLSKSWKFLGWASKYVSPVTKITKSNAESYLRMSLLNDNTNINLADSETLRHTIEDLNLHLHSLIYAMEYSMLSNSIREGIMQCRMKLLPPLAVTPKMVRAQWQTLQASVDKENLTPVIDPKTSTSLFYSLPLTACFVEKQTGLVQLHVPVVKKDESLKLLKVKKLPFRWQDYDCVADTENSLVVKDEISGKIYPVTNYDLDECRHATVGLCKRPQDVNMDLSQCARLATSPEPAKLSEIKAACSLKCEKKVTKTQYQLVRIGKDDIRLTNVPKGIVKLNCPDSLTKSTDLDLHQMYPNDFGNLQVRLGCGCSLTSNNGKEFLSSTRVMCNLGGGDNGTYFQSQVPPQMLDDLVIEKLPPKGVRKSLGWIPRHMRLEKMKQAENYWKLVAYIGTIVALAIHSLCIVGLFVLMCRQKGAGVSKKTLLMTTVGMADSAYSIDINENGIHDNVEAWQDTMMTLVVVALCLIGVLVLERVFCWISKVLCKSWNNVMDELTHQRLISMLEQYEIKQRQETSF